LSSVRSLPPLPARRSSDLSQPLQRGDRSDRAAVTAGDPDGAGGGPCLRPANAFGLLGGYGFHAHWGHVGWNRPDPDFPAGTLCADRKSTRLTPVTWPSRMP